jgi:hypothetical protein
MPKLIQEFRIREDDLATNKDARLLLQNHNNIFQFAGKHASA